MFYTHLSSGAGTMGPLVAGVPIELSITPPHELNQKFWKELIVYFPLIRYGQHKKRKIIRSYSDSKVILKASFNFQNKEQTH
jgi:hypothetical protein